MMSPDYGTRVFILVNAFNCRFQFWIADAFTRYTVQTAINYVCGYKFAVQPDCRPSARYFPKGITVSLGGLHYNETYRQNYKGEKYGDGYQERMAG